MPELLIVDDEQAICWGLSEIGRDLGYQVETVATAEDAMALAAERPFDLVCMDVRLPGMSGLEAIPRIRQINPSLPIVVMTAFGDLHTAVEAVRQGAFEYLVKPFEGEKVRSIFKRVLAQVPAADEADQRTLPVAGFVGQSPNMQHVFARVALAAAADANVLVQGESGTGKELVARAIHQFSSRSEQPFVVVNLAALSPSLAESELFGHVRGSFTGADQARTGLLQQAHRGTLFLDEVAEIPLSIQVKLLRSIEEKSVTPVGSNQSIAADFRVVAASHQDLERLVQQKAFRHDLFFRISSFQIHLPPLRERQDDIPLLARRFLQEFGRTSGSLLSPDAERELRNRPWWGNVRELRNAMEHALIVSRGATIEPEHLPAALQSIPDSMGDVDLRADLNALLREWTLARIADPQSAGRIYDQLLELVEWPVLQTLLREFDGQFSKSAEVLGLHRTTLRKKLDQLQLDRESPPS